MVVAYLEKLQNEYLNEKLDAEKKMNDIQIRLRENVAFIRLLEETNDSNYESFTPREVNTKNKEKIGKLKEEEKELEASFEQEKAYYSKCLGRLQELEEVLKAVKKETVSNQQNVEENQMYKMMLLETQENERQRISRELHDSTAQNLTSLVHKTELCSKLVDMDPIRCKLELNIISNTLRDVIGDTRRMIYNLRPMSFDDIGLDVTIERALEKLESSETKKIHFSVEGETYQINPVIGITLLRIIQEGCSNAIRHADPSLIQVVLHYETDRILVRIEDNGKGFDTDEVDRNPRGDNSGFGLSMMKERVYLLSGNISINSTKDNGTKILVDIPVEMKEGV